MTGTSRQMKLGAFLWATGHHIAAWRHPQAHVTAGVDIDHYAQLARTAEAAKFDMIFCEDAAGVREANVNIASQTSRSIGFEPISLLAALAVQTSRIGLVSTASTSYNEPYGLARTFLSLDHLSGGRAGWNLVTSASPIEAANFGSTGLRPHADRYERAREFAAVVAGLWRGVDNGDLNHDGQSFSVRDALDLPRSPQGAPAMVQAGASEDGKDLAARTADVVFTAAQTFEEAKAFYDDLKGRLATYGREPDDIKIMPGVAPVVAVTESEAREKLSPTTSASRCSPAISASPICGATPSTGHCLTCRPAKACRAGKRSSSSSHAGTTSRSGSLRATSPARAATGGSSVRRRRSPTNSRHGSRAARPTAST